MGSGSDLWSATRAVTGGNTLAAPITYEVAGERYVAIAAGHSPFVFGPRTGTSRQRCGSAKVTSMLLVPLGASSSGAKFDSLDMLRPPPTGTVRYCRPPTA